MYTANDSVKNSVQAGGRITGYVRDAYMQMYIHWSVQKNSERALAPIQVGLCATTLRSHNNPYEKMSWHWVTQP